MKVSKAFPIGALLMSLAPSVAYSSECKSTIEVVKLDQQPWYVAEDRAEAREFASPRNSRAQKMSIADIKVPPGVEIIEHHHLVMEEIYTVQSGSGIIAINGI